MGLALELGSASGFSVRVRVRVRVGPAEIPKVGRGMRRLRAPVRVDSTRQG